LKILEKNRVREYDDKGNLISERDATFEDMLEQMTTNYTWDITLDLKTGSGTVTMKKKG
jgi:hypothetical protein